MQLIFEIIDSSCALFTVVCIGGNKDYIVRIPLFRMDALHLFGFSVNACAMKESPRTCMRPGKSEVPVVQTLGVGFHRVLQEK